KVSDVPQWFIQSINIHSASASSEIMIGWSRFGTLEVSGHTGNAYRQLYSTLIDLIQTFLMLGAVVFGLLYLLLSLSLKSLERIRDQAKGIIENKFIIENKLPFTTEFRSATVAMNAMVAKVKDIFDRENETLRRYHELLYKDAETKLYNRRYLTAKLPDYLQSHSSLAAGVYVMLSLDGIDRLKREMGYQQDYVLLTTLANEMNAQFGDLQNVLIARLNDSDFFAVIPENTVASIRHLVERLMDHMQQKMEAIDSITTYVALGCSIGEYSEQDTLKSLFSRADHSVTEAKDKGNFTIDESHSNEESLILGRDEWRAELLQSIQESRMMLAFQSVVEYDKNDFNVLHEEILLRLLDKEGAIHNAGYFIPIAGSLGLVDLLDRYTIEKALKHLSENNHSAGMAINLSCDFIKKHSNTKWLREELAQFKRHTEAYLSFEVTNTVAINNLEAVHALSDMVKMYGYHFGIDHFVLPDSGADYLQIIRPDYVKSNSAYLEDMLYDKDTGNTRESLNNLTKSLGISIIAIMIENAQQMEVLKNLGITKFQGTYVAPVAMLK
ncbi:MAG TPA: EAL domain-containing protein, partial [Sulfuricurvum sp.]|nr:EAL domain-containing protein [Sulfuricurvum sp.]